MSRKISLVVVLGSILALATLLSGLVWQRSQNVGDQPYKQLGVLDEVIEHINDNYVTQPDMTKVTSGALHGMLEALDADSSYMDADEYKAYKAFEAQPPQAGIGIVVSKRQGYVDVVDVQPGSPAAQAGVERGDFIEAIGNDGTRDLSLVRSEEDLGGAPGTTVDLSVVHQLRPEPQRLTIKRVVLPVLPLSTSLVSGVGIVRVPDFGAGRTAQVAGALRTLTRQGASSFILDLRNCGSGNYTEAAETANLFLNHGEIDYLEGQTFPRQTFNADPAKDVVATTPLLVLINGGTAGPAELAAGALQQNKRAQLVGDKTFGEGAMQKVVEVGDGSAVLISVARYYTGAGKAIQDGITPDVQQVQYAGNLPFADTPPEGTNASTPDLQMQKAMAMLHAPAKS